MRFGAIGNLSTSSSPAAAKASQRAISGRERRAIQRGSVSSNPLLASVRDVTAGAVMLRNPATTPIHTDEEYSVSPPAQRGRSVRFMCA